jgi:hypothetical protein
LYVTACSEPAAYDVSLPEGGLGWEKVGPLFERYSTPLVGRIDECWVKAYQRVVESTPRLTRFRLDKFAGTVSFTCRATDGPVEVMSVLKILGEMLEQVNREASFAAAGDDQGASSGLTAVAATQDARRSGAKTRL